MKFHNIRFGFATNSSSSHSIVMIRPGYNGPPITTTSDDRWGRYSFGWEEFRLADVEEKTRYVIAQFVSNLRGEKLGFYEIQKLVYDVFGVELSEDDVGDVKYPDISVDHQSVLSVSTNNVDFWRAFHKFSCRSDVIILGGNDNSDGLPDDFVPAPHDKVEWVKQISDRGRDSLRIRRDGDVWVFFNITNGTKSRVHLTEDSDTSYVKASSPELVDLKITDYCPMRCRFCYQSSTKAGRHADKRDIFKIIRQLKKLGVFEIAIGGGEPTMHPDFAEILEYAYKNKIVPNFTTYSLAWLKDEKIFSAVVKYAGGIGVSIHNLKDIAKFKKIQDATRTASTEWPRPQVMGQHVLGTMSVAETAQLVEKSMEEYMPLLILGYKSVGFGQTYVPVTGFEDFPVVLKLTLGDKNRWCQISVDTAILQQYPDLLKVLEVSELLATSEEGKFSCYIDAVTGQMGPSSYAPNQMSVLPKTTASVKRLFATF